MDSEVDPRLEKLDGRDEREFPEKGTIGKTSRLDRLAQIDALRIWIAAHGGDCAGYVARYGDPGLPAADGSKMYGCGGSVLYEADMHYLILTEKILALEERMRLGTWEERLAALGEKAN